MIIKAQMQTVGTRQWAPTRTSF